MDYEVPVPPAQREAAELYLTPDKESRRREFCHSADTPSPAILKHLLKGEAVPPAQRKAAELMQSAARLESDRRPD